MDWNKMVFENDTGTGAPGGGGTSPGAPAGGGTGQQPAPAPSPQSTSGGEFQDVIKALRFDPFEPGNEPASGPADGGQTAEPAKTEPTPTPTPTSTPDLAGTVDRLSSVVETLAQGPQEQQKTADAEPALPPYDYNIPDEAIMAIASEDPNQRRLAINGLLKGASMTVHRQLRQEVQYVVSQVIPRMVNSIVQNHMVQQQVAQDFYTKYPELNNPVFYPMVQAVGQQLAATLKPGGWTPQFRDAVGAEVKRQIMLAGGGPVQQQGGTPAPLNGGGVRPMTAAPVNRATQEDQIADLLFG